MSVKATRARRRLDGASEQFLQPATNGAPALTAAALVLSGKRPDRRDLPRQAAAWQSEVWALLDEIGELWFAGSWMSSAQSRMKLVAAKVTDDGTDPAPLSGWATPENGDNSAPNPSQDDRIASRLVARFAGGPIGQAQLLARAGWQLAIAGDTYLVALAPAPPVLPDNISTGPVPDPVQDQGSTTSIYPAPLTPTDPLDQIRSLTDDADKWQWTAYSDQEIAYGARGYQVNDGSGVVRRVPDDALILRAWRPHPRRFHEAGCATRAALPILRELRGLTMHVGSQIDSRLAGAGLLMLPQSMTFPAALQDGDLAEGEDAFVSYLMEVMMTAIKDRDSASAVVPIVIKVPDDSIGKVQYLTFATPLDEQAPELRKEALRRLALTLDVPQEIILGKGDTSHWNAWNIDEQAVTMHVAPLTAVLCHALTVGWLQPLLSNMGVERPEDYVVWFDATALTLRPDRSADATLLFDRTLIGGHAMRNASGFSDADKPTDAERKQELLLRIIERVPTLGAIILPMLGFESPSSTDLTQAAETTQAIGGIDPNNPAAAGTPVKPLQNPIRDARQLTADEKAQIVNDAQSRGKPTPQDPGALGK